MDTELVVIGGGAAGLACALAAGRLGVRAQILERTDQPGRKLAVTGGRKGNFTHVASPREMAERFDCDRAWLIPLLRRFPHQRITKLFNELGISHRVDEDGCVWPIRTDAGGMRDTLVREVVRHGGVIRSGARVKHLVPGWTVILEDGSEIRAGSVCVATGGASYPRTGSTGDGLSLASELGLATVPWFPALASLETKDDLSEMAGITQPRVRMALVAGEDSQARTAEGHFIFAHRFVSGSSVLNLSGYAARALASGQKVALHLDWVPETNRVHLSEELSLARQEHPKQQLATCLTRYVSRRLAVVLARRVGVPHDRVMTSLSRAEQELVVAAMKETVLEVTGTEPMERATVTGGGVSLAEIDNTTLRARRFPGLYFAGEVIDTWAETGGYNLHFAWATGIAVAEAVSGRRLD